MGKKQLPSIVSFLACGLVAVYLLIVGVSATAAASYVFINNNNYETQTRRVVLSLSGPDDAVLMMISNSANFKGAFWQSFLTSKVWYLDYGQGAKTVYVKFKDKSGKESAVYSDTIQLTAIKNMQADFKVNNEAQVTTSRYVSLKMTWSTGVEELQISNSNSFLSDDWLPISSGFSWILSPGSGLKTVYVRFKDVNGTTKTVSKKITYNQPEHYLQEGILLKGQSSTVYYLGFDGKLHPFFNSLIYHSWYSSFKDIVSVSNAKLQEYPVGSPICVRQGTWLVRFEGSSKIYAVEPGCRLKSFRSETELHILYGPKWRKRVVVLPSILVGVYNREESESSAGAADVDKDGVDSTLESQYGSSDENTDSDEDGLSDYEEIYFWFTDPMADDTDQDGHKDGLEVVNGYSPLGNEKIASLPKGTYMYPEGLIVRGKKDGMLYYHKAGGKFYSISKDYSSKTFSSNNFDSRFVVNETFNIPFVSSGGLGSSVESAFRPQIRTANGALINL